MDVQIGGTNPGSQYSQLSVMGAVNLSGTLTIALVSKFVRKSDNPLPF